MQSNYKTLGDFIQPIKVKNSDLSAKELLGINVDKFFMPSVANIVGTDLSNYKVVNKNQFACNRMHVGRDYRIPIALSDREEPFMVSPAYDVFEIIDTSILHPDYLMMWFSRKEYDRNAWFYTDADVRGGLAWDAFCNMKFPLPSPGKQREIVAEYNTVKDRIELNNQLIQKLEETAQAIFNSFLDNNEEKENHRLGDLMEIKGGFSYNSEDLGKGKTYLLGMGCVSFTDRYVEEGMRLYSDNVPEQHKVNAKDIIIATRQQSENMPILGCPAMIPPNLNAKKLVIASNLYRVVNKTILSNEILYQILKSKNYQEHIKLHTKGTTVGMITKDAIEDYIFEAPSISLLYNFQEIINKIIDNVFLKRTENQKLTELKDLLLSKLATIEN
ncbi:MAG: restriction endonuclease subunit S [Bacteroidales bacterium]|nr:restriction endonuclease subunit S [Bacteroidales bacterium]